MADEQSRMSYLSFITKSQGVINEASARFRIGDIDGGSRLVRDLEMQLSDPRVHDSLSLISAGGIPGHSEAANSLATGAWRAPLVEAQEQGIKKSRGYLRATLGEEMGDLQDKINRGVATDAETSKYHRMLGSGSALSTKVRDENGATVATRPNLDGAIAAERITQSSLLGFGFSSQDPNYSTMAGDMQKVSEEIVRIGGEADTSGIASAVTGLATTFTPVTNDPAQGRLTRFNTLKSFGSTLSALSTYVGEDTARKSELVSFLKNVSGIEGMDADTFRNAEKMTRGFQTYLDNKRKVDVVLQNAEMFGYKELIDVDQTELLRGSVMGDDDPTVQSGVEKLLSDYDLIDTNNTRLARYSAGMSDRVGKDGSPEPASFIEQAAGRAYGAMAKGAALVASGKTDALFRGPAERGLLLQSLVRSGLGKFKEELVKLGGSDFVKEEGDEGIARWAMFIIDPSGSRIAIQRAQEAGAMVPKNPDEVLAEINTDLAKPGLSARDTYQLNRSKKIVADLKAIMPPPGAPEPSWSQKEGDAARYYLEADPGEKRYYDSMFGRARVVLRDMILDRMPTTDKDVIKFDTEVSPVGDKTRSVAHARKILARRLEGVIPDAKMRDALLTSISGKTSGQAGVIIDAVLAKVVRPEFVSIRWGGIDNSIPEAELIDSSHSFIPPSEMVTGILASAGEVSAKESVVVSQSAARGKQIEMGMQEYLADRMGKYKAGTKTGDFLRAHVAKVVPTPEMLEQSVLLKALQGDPKAVDDAAAFILKNKELAAAAREKLSHSIREDFKTLRAEADSTDPNAAERYNSLAGRMNRQYELNLKPMTAPAAAPEPKK